MQPLKLLRTTTSNWYNQEQDQIPAPGEAIIIHCVDTNKTELKIGDGKTALRNLPYISTKSKETIDIKYPIDKFIDLIPGEVWKIAREERTFEKDAPADDDEILESAIAILADTYYMYYDEYWNEEKLQPF